MFRSWAAPPSPPSPPPTPAPSASLLSAAALRLRDTPEFSWFSGIEDAMVGAETMGKNAREAAIEARIDMLHAKAQLLATTTKSSTLYANALLADPAASREARAAATLVMAWRQRLEAALDRAMQSDDLADVTRAVQDVAHAKWSMLEAAMDMATGGDAARAVTPAPTPAPQQACPTTHPRVTPGRGTPRQRRLLAYLSAKGEEFLAHMHETRPTLDVTRRLLTWGRRIESMSQLAEATSSTHAITLGQPVQGRCIAVAFDAFSSLPRMLTRVLHELAHVANDSRQPHGPAFYRILRLFLRIASEELGWTVEATCRETCFLMSEADATPDAACPKCVWQSPPGQCRPTAAKCEPAQVDRNRIAAEFANDPAVLAFLGAPPNPTSTPAPPPPLPSVRDEPPDDTSDASVDDASVDDASVDDAAVDATPPTGARAGTQITMRQVHVQSKGGLTMAPDPLRRHAGQVWKFTLGRSTGVKTPHGAGPRSEVAVRYPIMKGGTYSVTFEVLNMQDHENTFFQIMDRDANVPGPRLKLITVSGSYYAAYRTSATQAGSNRRVRLGNAGQAQADVGRWVRFRVDYFRDARNGSIEVYRDDDLVHSVRGIATMYSMTAPDAHLKFGQYKANVSRESVTYFADFRVAKV
jgi:hypothetical protein